MKKPLTIGLLTDYLLPAIIDGAGSYARQHSLRLDARWSVRADWMPGQPDWDGILCYLVDMENAYQRAMELGLPMVHLAGWLGKRALPRVECDYAACGMLAAREFKRLGLQRVAGVEGWRSGIDWRSLRGLRAETARSGMEFVKAGRLRRVEPWPQAMERLADRIAAMPFPCGFFSPHAGAVTTLLDALLARGVRVPDDVAVIVIDKDPNRTAELAPVPLTAVMPDFWQQGYDATGILHQMMRGETVGKGIRRVPPIGIVRRKSTGVPSNEDPVVAKVLHLISHEAGWKFGVDELASLSGVSRRSLETRFRRETGTTPHAAQMRQRMNEAKRLLRNPGRTVADVAEACGFSSVHYFTTAFKRETGVTPGRFR